EYGSSRRIHFDGIEATRAISFIVRDQNWGTYNAHINNLRIEEHPGSFLVTYNAETSDNNQNLHYSVRIEASSHGLRFAASATVDTDFFTNRTGFVVLHPCKLAGKAVTIEHTDNKIEKSHFPVTIDPLQPMLDLRALTHEPAPGLQAECRMEGDVYEMEDQRNWTD